MDVDRSRRTMTGDTVPTFAYWYWGKPGDFRLLGVHAEMRIQHLPSTNKKQYRSHTLVPPKWNRVCMDHDHDHELTIQPIVIIWSSQYQTEQHVHLISTLLKKFPSILWNPKAHYRVHQNCPFPLVHILSQTQPTSPHPISSKSILILSTHLRFGLPSGLFPSGFYQSYTCNTIRANSCYMSSPSHPPWLHHSNFTLLWVRVMKLLLSLHPSLIPIFSSATCSQTDSPKFSLNARHQISHRYITTDKIIILYILISTFLGSRREDKRFWTER
jgi:hypothetical protein